jgi:hypothetical protein
MDDTPVEERDPGAVGFDPVPVFDVGQLLLAPLVDGVGTEVTNCVPGYCRRARIRSNLSTSVAADHRLRCRSALKQPRLPLDDAPPGTEASGLPHRVR